MDTLTFISKIFASLVWPATIVIILWTYRKPVSRRLQALSKLAYKDLTMDFRREMSELETAALNVKSTIPDNMNDDVTPTQTGRNVIPKSRDEDVNQVAEVSPSAAISLSWSIVEKSILLAALRLAIFADGSPHSSALQNIRSLHKVNAIDKEMYNVLERMRQIRNKAVTGQYANVDISTEDALDYHQLTLDMVKKLNEIHQ